LCGSIGFDTGVSSVGNFGILNEVLVTVTEKIRNKLKVLLLRMQVLRFRLFQPDNGNGSEKL
jgi:hypothetical protein